MRGRFGSIVLATALLAGCGGGGQAAAPTAPLATAAPRPPAAAPSPMADAPTDEPTAEAATAAADEPSAIAATPLAPSPSPAPTAAPALGDLRLGIEPLAEGFEQPTQVTSAGDGSGRLFVVEQVGRIWAVRNGERLPEPFLDIVELVGSGGNEQGLLSVAFHPRHAENGLLYVNYTDRNSDTVVARYAVAADSPDRADPSSAMVLLSVDQPASNHNGGLLKFGPDGMLYIGMGDGGQAGDPWGNAQSLDTLLGKLLRIDIDGEEPYTVPADNPLVSQEGARPEIWAYGLRNPWRFSFDRVTGDLYIGDVGQNAQEEVHFQPANSPGGENYGWDIMEGSTCYDAATCDQEGLAMPVAVYSHGSEEGGCSITGGYVYRGAAYPQLNGVYLYTDFCSGNLWALRAEGGAWQSALIGKAEISPSSFGEDEAGELLLADRQGGGIYRVIVVNQAP